MEYGSNVFTAVIDQDGIIYEAGTGRKRQVVGIDTQKEQEYIKTIAELRETLDNYYNKLVSLGVITPPKTPEEIAAEQLKLAQEQAAQQAEINSKLLEAIGTLKAEIKEIKDHGYSEEGGESAEQGGKRGRTRKSEPDSAQN